MAKTKQGLIDAAVKHQIFIQRYAGQSNKQLLAFIRKINAETQALLEAATEGTLTKLRYQKLLANIKELEDKFTPTLLKSQKEQLNALAKYEAEFTARLLDRSANLEKAKSDIGFETVVPTIGQIRAGQSTSILDLRPGYHGGKGGTISDMLEDFSSKQVGSAIGAVRMGFANGSTINQIAKSVAESLGSKINRNQAQAVARTTVNHVASTARDTFYQENADIITHYEIVATLDDRTTLTCGALDGQEFPIEGFNAPPYHWNCRTTFIGVVNPKYSALKAGNRPASGSNGNEQVKGSTTYSDWIGRQSKEFQDEVLGPERAELLRAGMSFDKFVDENYSPITIDELRTKDNEHIFTKAGL